MLALFFANVTHACDDCGEVSKRDECNHEPDIIATRTQPIEIHTIRIKPICRKRHIPSVTKCSGKKNSRKKEKRTATEHRKKERAHADLFFCACKECTRRREKKNVEKNKHIIP